MGFIIGAWRKDLQNQVRAMVSVDRRAEERKKACVQAFVSDLGDALDVKCVVRDVCTTGCKIISSRVHELPEFVQLVPEDFDQPIRGRIVWRRKNMAGLCFEHACSDEVRAAIQALSNSFHQEVEDDILLLQDQQEPLDYFARLEKYRPPRD